MLELSQVLFNSPRPGCKQS